MKTRLALAASLTLAAALAERDWRATLRADAQALHDAIAVDHPGPVNRRDPGFARRNDAQLALALDRARTARDYAAYYFAMRLYAASFDDGHLDFSARGRTPFEFGWPGLLTAFDRAGAQRVMASVEPSVPVGARLIGCDGRSADQVAAATLGRTEGRWFLQSQRRAFGQYLLVDTGNRYVMRPRRCSFGVGGRMRAMTLRWRPISFAELGSRLGAGVGAPPPAFGARALVDGTRWFALPSFAGDPASREAITLRGIIDTMRADRAALVRVPAIVLDLRGNGGGSSDWSREIARILWGEAAVARVPDSGATAEFRVSRANLAAYEALATTLGEGGSPELRRIVQATTSGLRAALARGDRLWRRRSDTVSDQSLQSDVAPSPPLGGPVYFVTDSRCVSACLDAVDLWRALGAIHVGETTSADSLYMEAPPRVLPSGLGVVTIPMKVFRDRARGSNVPVVPTYAFAGDITDTAALERWIASLPR